jgi:hypothetical protein
MHSGNWFEEIGWTPKFLFCPLRPCGYRRVPTTASLRLGDIPVEAGAGSAAGASATPNADARTQTLGVLFRLQVGLPNRGHHSIEEASATSV